ncbi:MAG: hypothetical protein MSA15_09475 [Clostridium sp.]|nr:hypothetical protein [Clostridium sp.]
MAMNDALTENKEFSTDAPAEFEYIKMDYKLKTAEERVEKVKEIIANTPSERLTQKYLEKLSDYIVIPIERQERKKNHIITDNHNITVTKREMSFEGLVGRLENGEDGIYNMIANDKNIIFQPKVSITPQDLEEMPELKKLHEAILKVEEQLKTARGKTAYKLRKQLIEMRKDQYVIKGSYKKPIYSMNLIKSASKIDLSEKVKEDKDNGTVSSNGLINFFNEKHISALLCNYSKLKEDSWDKFNNDMKWMMMDLDVLVDNALKEKYPLYYDIVIYKIDGKQNAEIQQLLYEKHGIKHSVEYISCLWRNKIPKLIAEQAQKDWLIWHYTFEDYGKWKRCSRCGQIKLAHNYYFSKNKTSRDGYYSICKECRNKKNK